MPCLCETQRLSIIVCHHPSKDGGRKEGVLRAAAASECVHIEDRVAPEGVRNDRRVVSAPVADCADAPETVVDLKAKIVEDLRCALAPEFVPQGGVVAELPGSVELKQ
jgi:hypothetical protein